MSRKSKKIFNLNVDNLRKILWETLLDVRKQNISSKESNAISQQAREICRISKIELDYYRAANKKPNVSDGIFG